MKSQWRIFQPLDIAQPCSFPKSAELLRGSLSHGVRIVGPFYMSGQSRDLHDLSLSAGRIRRRVGCSTANAQVLSNHLQQ
jgi:hypothetical protein